MENWCSNTVQFRGDPEALQEIDWLFRAMSALEKESQQGQCPPFTDLTQGSIFNIDFFDDKIYFETAATPNIDLLVKIADRYQTDFRLDYHELSCSVFGEASYEQGLLNDIRLDIEDFEQFNYDLKKQAYTFEGEYYDSDAEILEMMLATKKGQLNNSYGHRR